MKAYYKKICMCLVLLMFSLTSAFAQKTVSGIVTDAGGPVPGVSVTIKGTTRGAQTNNLGRYVIQDVKEGQVLVFRSVGYKSRELTVGKTNTLNASIESDNSELQEVVVTAMGVQRDRRSLGYATSTLKSAELTVAGPPLNPFLAVYGKAAGVGVQTGSAGPAGGINIRIRGAASLNPDISARPLVVIDGVQIRDKATDMVNRTYDPYNSVDYGSGLNDLNADDIESIEILKGAKATVLYGRDAGFGVLLITTKKGREVPGFGISAGFNTSIDKPVSFIDFQNDYGTGNSSSDFQYATINGAQVRKLSNQRWSFGPRFDGADIMMYDSTMTKYQAYPDNFIDMFKNGMTNTANVAVEGGGQIGNMRLSYTNKAFKDILPGFEQNNHTFSFSGAINASKLARVEVNANYYNIKTTNRRPNMEQVVAWGLNRDYDYNFVNRFYKDNTSYLRVLDNYSLPPSFTRIRSILMEQYDNRDVDTRSRWLASIRTTLTLAEYLSFVGSAGIDYTNTDYLKENRVTRINPVEGGQFGVGKAFTGSTNFQGMFNFDKGFINNNLRIFAFAGGSYRYQKDDDIRINTFGNLAFPEWYSFGNEINWPEAVEKGKVRSYSRGSDVLYSAFGSLTASWKERYHLEVQMRNDWDSTLPPGNNSYFYPGVSFTYNYNKFLNWDSFKGGTLRASWADVGFGTNRYAAFEAYDVGFVDNSNTIKINNPARLYATEFVPARKREFEFGINNRFFEGNRLEFDLTYYNNNTRNEIIPIDISAASGNTQYLVNTGRVDRWGIEALVKVAPIYNASAGLRWDITLTGSVQRSKIADLAPGLNQLTMAGVGGGANVVAEVGKPYGDIKMFDYLYDGSGNKVVTETGQYQRDAESYKKVANVNPNLFGGLITDLSYKNFNFHVAADYKFGGRIFSISNYYLIGNGVVKSTLPGRDQSTGGLAYYVDANDKKITWQHDAAAPSASKDGIVYHNGMILPGVKSDGSGGFLPNDIIVSSSEYYQTYINDAGGYYFPDKLFKNDYIKLREVAVSYMLPDKFVKSLKLQRVSLTAAARNLFFIYKTLPNVDAESALGAQGYQENSFYPSVRSFNFGINVKF